MRKLIILLLVAGPIAYFTQTQAEMVQIEIPPGFEGPESADLNPEGHIDAYVRRIPGTDRGTLLQITTYDFGSKLSGVPEEELGNGAENYLMQLLAGIERKRTSFSASKPIRVTLGGLPAARVEWTGVARGKFMSGIMYSVIVGTTVVNFHTQGFRDSPPSDRTDALRAIETATFNN